MGKGLIVQMGDRLTGSPLRVGDSDPCVLDPAIFLVLFSDLHGPLLGGERPNVDTIPGLSLAGYGRTNEGFHAPALELSGEIDTPF